jgi:hypothetical protein
MIVFVLLDPSRHVPKTETDYGSGLNRTLDAISNSLANSNISSSIYNKQNGELWIFVNTF